jgi:hypothetical protein
MVLEDARRAGSLDGDKTEHVPAANVYIMAAEGTLPVAGASLAEQSLLFHCSVRLIRA